MFATRKIASSVGDLILSGCISFRLKTKKVRPPRTPSVRIEPRRVKVADAFHFAPPEAARWIVS